MPSDLGLLQLQTGAARPGTKWVVIKLRARHDSTAKEAEVDGCLLLNVGAGTGAGCWFTSQDADDEFFEGRDYCPPGLEDIVGLDSLVP